MAILEEETVSRIKKLLSQNPKGMMISDLASRMKISRNIMSKYLDILLMAGQVEMDVRGNAKFFFLSRRIPLPTLFEFSRDYVIVLDDGGKILWANNPVLEYLSLTFPALSGKSLREIDDPLFRSLISREDPDKPGLDSEISCRLNGKAVHFRVQQTPVVLPEGSRGTVITLEDITAQVQSKELLELSEARFRAIIEDQTEYVTRFAHNGALTFVNGSYARYLERSPEELIGTPHIPGLYEENLPLFREHIRSLDRTNEVTTLEIRVVDAEGRTRLQQWTIRALCNEKGEIAEYQGVGRDITEQAEAEDHIRQHAADMEFISRKAREFLELPPEADLYAAIAEGLSELLPEAGICVSSFDANSQALTIRNICGPGVRETIQQIAGRDMVGFSFIMNDPGAVEFMKIEGLHRAYGDIYTAVFGQIPYPVCKQVEEELDLDEIYILGLVSQGQLFGSAAILPRKGNPIPNPALVEAFLHQASLVLAWRKTDEDLRKSETRFRAIVEDQTEFITRFLPDGSLTYVNRSYSRYMGKEPEELVGQPHIPYITSEVVPLLQQHFGEPGQNGLVMTVQFRVMSPAGSVRWQQWTIRALFNEKGEIAEYQGVGRDITELHEAEESARQHVADREFLSRKTREFLRLPPEADIYHAIMDGLRELAQDATVAVESFDPHISAIVNRCVWPDEVRTLFRELTGEDLIGKSLVVSDPDAVAGMKSGIIQRVPGGLYYAMFGAVPILTCQQIEETFEMGDMFSAGMVSRDRLLGVVAIIQRRGQPLEHRNLIETYLQLASIALAQRLDADALRQSEARFRAVIEDQTDFITRFLPDGTLTFVNAPLCNAMKKDPVDLLGRSFFSMIPDEDRGILETGLRSLTADNPKMTIEHRITGPDGGIRWFRWTTRAIFDDQGRPVEYDGIGRDITELHEAAARIRKHPADIKFLSRNAKSLAGIRTCDEIFSVTAKNLRSVIPDAFVGVCTYTPAAKTLVFRCIAGNPDELGIMNHELERDLAGAVFIFDADAEHLALFSSKRLVPGPGHLGLFFRSLSPDICARAAERLNFGKSYLMGLPSRDGAIDMVLIQMKAGMDIPNPELIEAAISQAGMALSHTQDK